MYNICVCVDVHMLILLLQDTLSCFDHMQLDVWFNNTLKNTELFI